MSMLTINDIAFRAQKTQQALIKNADIEKYVVGKRTNGGRPAKLYHPDVLKLFIVVNDDGEKEENITVRKTRADKGGLRKGRKQHVVEHLVRLAFTEYMSSAVEDVRSACRRAIKQMYKLVESGEFPATIADVDICAKSEWLYFNYINRCDSGRRGIALVKGWELAHREKWHEWDAAMKSGSNRYCFWKIAENGLGAEKGFGGGRFVMMDDRKTDVWIRNENGGFEMTYAVYAWDVLTQELLWVERAEGGNAVSTNDYVRCMLGVIYRYGINCQVWHIENSRAAKGLNATGAIRALYTDSDMEFFSRDDIKKLYRIKSQRPGEEMIVRNIPHIPKDLGKAIGERLFGHVKRWDSLVYPQSFHGGSIKEAVQLTRSVTPTLGNYTPSANEYFHGLFGEPYQDYLDQPRSALKEWARTHQSEPTRRAMIDWYSPAEITMPSPEQTALLLYYASTERHTVRMREWGQLDCTINLRSYRLRAKQLTETEFYKQKLTVIPVPGRADECAVYDANGKNVRFVCMAKDFTGVSVEQAHTIRVEGRTIREDAHKAIREYTNNTLLGDPVELANTRRATMPELSPKPTQAEVYFTEVVDEKEDERLIGNFYNTL